MGGNGFQSTLPLRGATWMKPTPTVSIKISIHAPLAGSDSWSWTTRRTAADFNPRSPCGERPGGDIQTASTALIFQSTLPLRGATDLRGSAIKRSSISIHAPLAGSDLWPFICCWLTEFQSTLPLRGATCRSGSGSAPGMYFNPRSPCGERRLAKKLHHLRRNFNPRSPCGERLATWWRSPRIA